MSNLFIRKNIRKDFIIFIKYQRRLLSQASDDKIDELPERITTDYTVSCNKSGLLNHHRNMLYEKCPYKEPSSWIHLTEKYQRKVFGRYGFESGIIPNICFNTKSDKISKTLYETIAEPDTIHSMINKCNVDQKRKIDAIANREEEICKKLEKLNQWKQELNSKILKKEADAIAAKAKKDRLIEEVRRHFGYKVDPKDERFKEVLEQKEKEDRKKLKEEKRKAKEQKLMSKLVEKPVIT